MLRAKTFAFVALLLLSGLCLFAADAPAAGIPAVSNTDGKYISFDLGMVGGINLGANAATVGRTFGMNFTLSDSMSAGFLSTTAGGTSYTLMKLAYFFTPALGVSIYVGSDAAGTAGGAGIFYNVAKSRPDSGFSTALKLRLEYLSDTGVGLTKGDIVLSVGSSIGL
jgi:hypothetical protein